MQKKPALIVMAAGMGSRYGGLKQIDPVGGNGEIIVDYSVYDAKRAGFVRVVFILSEAIEKDFRETIGKRISAHMDTAYAVQRLNGIPEGFSVPEGRKKPWGTGQAVLCAKNLLDGPFAVINADDYYGPEAFKLIYDYLVQSAERPAREQYSMAGYLLKNTVTEHGHVARGVCEVDSGGCLSDIAERTMIRPFPDGIKFSEDGGASWAALADDKIVSMNFWGFPAAMMDEIEIAFPKFLSEEVPPDPMKAEFYVPVIVGGLVRAGKAHVKVLPSGDKWYGVTYREDKAGVCDAIAQKVKSGLYPDNLWA